MGTTITEGASTTQERVTVLDVEGLRIVLDPSGVDIDDEVSMVIHRGEVLGLVGESASGKTTVGTSLLDYQRRGAKIAGGRVEIDGQDILAMDPAALRGIRGGAISYVPQDSSAALNPALRIGTQLMEILEVHGFGSSQADREARLKQMMEEVLLPSDRQFLRRYPHQLSGGQQQRVAIAMAFANRPKVIVLDEPTTALDVTTQAHVLDTVRDLTKSYGVAALYITHDLAVVSNLADRIAVMYAGRVVEVGTRDELFDDGHHPYTRKLLGVHPRHHRRARPARHPRLGAAPGAATSGLRVHPALRLGDRQVQRDVPAGRRGEPRPSRALLALPGGRGARRRDRHPAARQVALGSPRTGDAGHQRPRRDRLLPEEGDAARHQRQPQRAALPVARRASRGPARRPWPGASPACTSTRSSATSTSWASRWRATLAAGRATTRQAIQYIFQSPYSSLNPRKTIAQILSQPLKVFFDLSRDEMEARMVKALEQVALDSSLLSRYPDQLSGGERQRLAIARSLAAEPTVLICDEVTSWLDVSVQAAIIELLAALQRDMGLSMLFVTHNLALVRSISQEVAVMNDGRIVEYGLVDAVLEDPQADYTKKLLSDTPTA